MVILSVCFLRLRFIYVYTCYSVDVGCLSVCLSVSYAQSLHRSVYLFIYLGLSLSVYIRLSICLPIPNYSYLYICLSIHLSVSVSTHVYPSVHLPSFTKLYIYVFPSSSDRTAIRFLSPGCLPACTREVMASGGGGAAVPSPPD